jgi:hypothetical protein
MDSLMTNRYAADPYRLPNGKYLAMIRLCRDAHPSPIMDAGGKPKVFGSKGEAAEECLKHMLNFMNGKPIRGEMFDGPSVKEAKFARAESLFRMVAAR